MEDRTGIGGHGGDSMWYRVQVQQQPLHNSITPLLHTWSAVSFTQSMKVATSAANTGSTVKVKWE